MGHKTLTSGRFLLICEVCGCQRELPVQKGRPRLYCSPGCAEVARLRAALSAAEGRMLASAEKPEKARYRAAFWHRSQAAEAARKEGE